MVTSLTVGDHLVRYIKVESLFYMPETHIMLHVKYNLKIYILNLKKKSSCFLQNSSVVAKNREQIRR